MVCRLGARECIFNKSNHNCVGSNKTLWLSTKYAQEDALACERLSSLVRNHLKLWSPVMVRRVLHPECLPAAQDARETCLFGSWVGGGSARCGSRAARERGARACEGGVVVELCARDCVGEERSW